MIGTSARDTVDNATIGASVSTRLPINTAHTRPRKAQEHANSPKIQYWDPFGVAQDKLFRRTSTADFSSVLRVFAILSVILPPQVLG